MTDEELQAIWERWFVSGEQGPEFVRPVPPFDQALDVATLLAEVERLRAENAGLRDLAKWLDAELPDHHTVIAMQARARELLGKSEEEDE